VRQVAQIALAVSVLLTSLESLTEGKEPAMEHPTFYRATQIDGFSSFIERRAQKICAATGGYVRRRIAEARLRRETPLKIRLIPMIVPMNQRALLGH
jgi:hypothetical protein